MTDQETAAAIVPPDRQQNIWFLGKLLRIRAGAEMTSGRLAIIEHRAERGFSSPLHRHEADDETFLVLDGELRIEVDGQASAAGPGAVAFLPRRRPHTFIVTSPQARYLTLHTPAGWDQFATAAGTPATDLTAPPPADRQPDPAALAALAANYGIEILGPPLSL